MMQTLHRKNIKMRVFLPFLFFILVVNLGYGSILLTKPEKPKQTKPAVLQVDTSTAVGVRHFNESALKDYRRQPEFNYNEEATDLSGWTRFWRQFWNWITHLFDFSSKRGLTIVGVIWKVIELLLIAGGLGALAFFIVKSMGLNVLNIFQRKPTTAPIPYSEFFEDINKIDFDVEIENAVSKHNYRFAVRLLYLKCLKQLSDSGLIAWQIDKTNNTYINELTNDEQRTAFKMLTRQFEYIWYGEFLIDAPIYKDIDLSFRNFNNRAA
ncbi:MAG: hypothetical protein JWP37_3797 [Mucilaginibacter sp.]|nr:hypothetical protein [Mucilaginibacter sp.]